MLSRIIRRSLVRRRRRKLLSLVAVALGITVATAVATIALDVGDKVNRELGSFGGNILVTPAANALGVSIGGVEYRPSGPSGSRAFLEERDLPGIKRIFWRNNITAFAPSLDVPVELRAAARSAGPARAATLAGTWFDHPLEVGPGDTFTTGVRKLHPDWRVDGAWPSENDLTACLVGRGLARTLGVRPGQRVLIGKTSFAVTGILDSGTPADEQALAQLESVQRLAGLGGKIGKIEVSSLIKPDDALARSDPAKMKPDDFERWSCANYASTVAYQIQHAVPGSEARPVYAVAETQGRVLQRVGVIMWMLVAAGLITAGLAVASTMLASVLERRTEIALYQSLGATGARIASVFLLEAVALGALGGVAGYAAGSALARHLATAVFGLPSGLHWVLLPAAVGAAMTVAVAGSAVPLARSLKISPALALRD